MKKTRNLKDALQRRLLFLGGKGGVGKTVVSQAIAELHAQRGKKTLWVTFEDPTLPQAELMQKKKNLWHINCEASAAFEEYVGIKIGAPRLTKLFIQNKVMRYLSKASPGIHELVLLGKVWYERQYYDHVVVDMPSTGYGLAMFQSTANFAKLFSGGPIHNDAESMLETFKDSSETAHLIVSLPEEMPLVESLELQDYLLNLFPKNPPAFLVNRRFPKSDENAENCPEPPHTWENPLATSANDYARKRDILEAHNLRLWKDQSIEFAEIEMTPPPLEFGREEVIVSSIAQQLSEKGYL